MLLNIGKHWGYKENWIICSSKTIDFQGHRKRKGCQLEGSSLVNERNENILHEIVVLERRKWDEISNILKAE